MTLRMGVAAALVMFVAVPALADEMISVPVDGSVVMSSPLIDGHAYEIFVEGTYTYTLPGKQPADAEWFHDGYDWKEELATHHPWNLDLLIDGVGYDWMGTADGVNFYTHTYSPSHVYKLVDYIGEGLPIALVPQHI